MELDLKEIDELRSKYIKKVIVYELGKIGLTQPEVAEKIGVNFRNLHPYIWGPRIKKDDEYYDLIFKNVLGFSDKKISEIKAEARLQQAKAEFGEDFIKEKIIEDNGQEPITTVEEAEKVLFKLNGLKYSDKAKRKLRLAIDMIKEDEKEDELK